MLTPTSPVPPDVSLNRKFKTTQGCSSNYYHLSTLVLNTYNQTIVLFVGFWQVRVGQDDE